MIKKILNSLILLFVLNGASASDPGKKDPPPPEGQSSMLIFSIQTEPVFEININDSFINITGDGYIGIVSVVVLGTNGFSTDYMMNNSLNENIDISQLASGIYTIQIITSSGISNEIEFVR
jgi:hypothetical protein